MSFDSALLSIKRGVRLLPALAAAVLLAGCGDSKVEVYKLAKDSSQSQQPEAAPNNGQAPMSGGMPPGHPNMGGMISKPQWQVPDGWQEAPPGEMRVGSFKVVKDGKQADVGVVPLPGLMGHDLDNVNRWRETVGLPHTTEEELSKLAQPVEMAGQLAQVYEQAGENPGSGDKTRILAAIYRRDNVAWFVKMMGDDELVAQQKPAFIEFLKSFKFPATMGTDLPPGHPSLDATPMMAGQGASPAAAPMADGGDDSKPNWQVPSDWKEVPGGQFLIAKFALAGSDNTQAAVNVSRSVGTGGGLAMNINRWRGQLGLAPWSDSELQQQTQTLDTPGGKATWVEMTGTDARSGQKAALVGIIVPQADQTWFYKLMGNADLVQKQKDAFTGFVKSAK
jgi:hypothetical protein